MFKSLLATLLAGGIAATTFLSDGAPLQLAAAYHQPYTASILSPLSVESVPPPAALTTSSITTTPPPTLPRKALSYCTTTRRIHHYPSESVIDSTGCPQWWNLLAEESEIRELDRGCGRMEDLREDLYHRLGRSCDSPVLRELRTKAPSPDFVIYFLQNMYDDNHRDGAKPSPFAPPAAVIEIHNALDDQPTFRRRDILNILCDDYAATSKPPEGKEDVCLSLQQAYPDDFEVIVEDPSESLFCSMLEPVFNFLDWRPPFLHPMPSVDLSEEFPGIFPPGEAGVSLRTYKIITTPLNVTYHKDDIEMVAEDLVHVIRSTVPAGKDVLAYGLELKSQFGELFTLPPGTVELVTNKLVGYDPLSRTFAIDNID